MLLFNIFITFMCLVGCYCIYIFVIAKARNDERKFAVYAFRDDLAMLAMKGVINPESDEYKFVIRQFNLAINFFDTDFSIMSFVSSISNESTKPNKKVFNRVLSLARKNNELEKILSQYFQLVQREIYKELALALIILRIGVWCFSVLGYFVKLFTHKNYQTMSDVVIRNRINGVRSYDENILSVARKSLAY